jgi:plasmid stabilization system protein ParE
VDYHLFYTQRALSDLADIVGHIAEDDAETASRFGASLVEHVELLTRFPRMGGLIQKRAHIRKLLHSPFLVYYRVRDTCAKSRFFTSVTEPGNHQPLNYVHPTGNSVSCL